MSLLRSESTKYIFLKYMEFDLGMHCVVFRRGEICEKLDANSARRGYILFSDRIFGRKELMCTAKDVARLTEAEAKYLIGIDSLEDRYEAFKERCRFEKNLRAGTKVFVSENGREYPGVVKVVLPGSVVSSPEPAVFKVEIQETILPDGVFIPSRQKTLRRSSNGNVVMVSFHKLRPRYESNRRPSANHQLILTAEQSARKISSQTGPIMIERKQTAESKSYKKARELIASTQLALEDKEKDLAISEQISDEFEKELTIEQEINKELERKLAWEQKAKKGAEHRFQTSEQRVQELETTLVKERHAHEQTKENVKERSQQLNKLDASLASTQKSLEEKEKELISIKQILAASKEIEKHHEGNERQLNELQKKITCEQKAKEETEKLLQSCHDKTIELETTLATTQKLLKRKKEPEDECEWILNREEIHLNEEKLGSGAFGTVYKGMFRGTQVAVKQVSVKPRITEYTIGKFRKEMKMASRCRHPCMLQFIGATSDDQCPLLVTELLDTSLKAVLNERALDLVEIETIALDVAKGLNYLHLNQPHPIVHRDISSGNVLLWKHEQSWRGKISDYGNAVLMNYARTGSGGALSYLAPEMNNQRCSTKSDVYSYGVLLLEMCLREEPSCLDNRDELICLVEDGGLRELIRSCLQQDAKQRPAMEEVLAVLTTAASQLTGTN